MNPGIHALVDLSQAAIERIDLPLPANINISADVLRIDKIHATVSGNKWFKLKYALQEAMAQQKNNIVTFGGAYSNHLVATACACQALGLATAGIVRGERPAVLSPSLQECAARGMQLQFLGRDAYKAAAAEGRTNDLFPGAYVIPEGGQSPLGVRGAADILQLAPMATYSHVCCAVGTGTMMAGLVNSIHAGQQATGISALKLPDTANSIEAFLEQATGGKTNYSLHYHYHFGGYAKRTPALLQFMNDFFARTRIPLDFVYTAKLMYGVTRLAEQGFFPAGSRLLIIHSGGLQGNRSLPKNALVF